MKVFIQRKHSLLIKNTERVIDDYQKSFQEYDIRDGTQLLMKEINRPSKPPRHQLEEEKDSSTM